MRAEFVGLKRTQGLIPLMWPSQKSTLYVLPCREGSNAVRLMGPSQVRPHSNKSYPPGSPLIFGLKNLESATASISLGAITRTSGAGDNGCKPSLRGGPNPRFG